MNVAMSRQRRLLIGTISGVVISAVSHEGISVTVDGKAARLAILTDDGRVIAAGNQVAKEVEAVALNSYRNFLKGQGFLRVHSKRSFNRDLASDADLSL